MHIIVKKMIGKLVVVLKIVYWARLLTFVGLFMLVLLTTVTSINM